MGLNLFDPSGSTAIEEVTVHFQNVPYPKGVFTVDDLMPIDQSILSGVALFYDGSGPSNGFFD